MGMGPGCKTKINSEFNSIHYGIEIQQTFKILNAHKFLGLKNIRKFLGKFHKNFEKSQTFLDPNNFGFQKF